MQTPRTCTHFPPTDTHIHTHRQHMHAQPSSDLFIPCFRPLPPPFWLLGCLSQRSLETGNERRGGWEERRGRLMFNWKRYAGFSLICARKCRLSHSLPLSFSPSASQFYPFPPHFFPSSSPLSLKNAISVCSLSCLSSAFSFFLPPRSLIFSLCSFLPASQLCVVLLPLSTQAMIWCCAPLSRFGACARRF